MSPCFVFSSVTTYRKDEQKLGNTHGETALWARYQPSCPVLLLGQWPAPGEVGHCFSFPFAGDEYEFSRKDSSSRACCANFPVLAATLQTVISLSPPANKYSRLSLCLF